MFYKFENNNCLVEDLIRGDEKAYTYLINNYHKKLFVYALSLTNDHALSQDIVQNVFIRTWEFRYKLKSNFSIENFLYKSVYNEFVNQYHRKQSISVLEKVFVEALSEVKNEDYQELLSKRTALIVNEIENLPRKCKRTFLLSKKEGLTNTEIAEYLNISIKTVEYHIAKAYNMSFTKFELLLKNI